MRVAVVVPTCRGFTIPEQSIPVEWYIVHDEKKRPIEGQAHHIVAPSSERYGQKSDTIRSAGFLAAFHDDADFILTTDDDCQIPETWAEEHLKALRAFVPTWSNTSPFGPMRGLPKNQRQTVVGITHGLWDGVPDLSGEEQVRWEREGKKLTVHHQGTWERIHPPFPQSSMNLGFRSAVTPVMYQPFQGGDTGYDRFGDIWCGLFAQRILHFHGYAFLNGGAIVRHNRASDSHVNASKEARGSVVHEQLWQQVWTWEPSSDRTVGENYLDLAEGIGLRSDDYFKRLRDNMIWWVDQCGL